MSDLKFCVNCKHHAREFINGGYFDRCRRGIIEKFDLVTGAVISISHPCRLVRDEKSSVDFCGIDAIYFEPKTELHPSINHDFKATYHK